MIRFFSARLFLLLLPLILLASCEKDPGPGGTSSIEGRIYVKDYNSLGVLTAEYYGQDEKVYLQYGDNVGLDDDVNTDANGYFKFEFLQKGTYKVFAYSDCDACDSDQEAIELTVEISEKRTEYTTTDIEVRR